MKELTQKLAETALLGDVERTRELIRSAMAAGGPQTPLDHFVMGFAIGRMYAALQAAPEGEA